MQKLLPKKYQDRLLKVNIPGINEYAWKYDDLVEFLNDKLFKNYVILGGDLMTQDESGAINYADTNWHIEKRSPQESFESYSQRSKDVTFEFLKKINATKEDLFILVLNSDPTAGL